jgi:hypothetical protein
MLVNSVKGLLKAVIAVLAAWRWRSPKRGDEPLALANLTHAIAKL